MPDGTREGYFPKNAGDKLYNAYVRKFKFQPCVFVDFDKNDKFFPKTVDKVEKMSIILTIIPLRIGKQAVMPV